jgi:hypothetical protein
MVLLLDVLSIFYDFIRKYVCNQRRKLYHYEENFAKFLSKRSDTDLVNGIPDPDPTWPISPGSTKKMRAWGGGGGVGQFQRRQKKVVFFIYSFSMVLPAVSHRWNVQYFRQSCPHLSLTEIYPCSPDESVTYVECTVFNVPQDVDILGSNKEHCNSTGYIYQQRPQ